jgi:transposase
MGREHQDAEILQSLPGIGVRTAGSMLAEAAIALRARDYLGLRILGGCAPVTVRSGKSCVVHMRYACHDRARSALRCWAMGSIGGDPRSRRHYQQSRAKGHNHERALRGVVDRLLPLLMAMLKSRTLYDANRRTTPAAARQNMGSPNAGQPRWNPRRLPARNDDPRCMH